MAIKTQTLKANGAQILNTIRANANYDYQSRVPEATQENIKEVGNAILSYQATTNAFLSALINRIGLVLITSRMYENPLREFKKGKLGFGETVEEIFVNIAQAQHYDPSVAENEVFKREIPDVKAIFHRMDRQDFYKATISNDQLRTAFLSYQGIEDLIGRIVDSLYSGDNYDEFLCMKQLLIDYTNNGYFYSVTIPGIDTADNARQSISLLREYSNNLTFMSNAYNSMGVATTTPRADQLIILDTHFDAVVDVEVLAQAFNMDKADFLGRRVLIDNFGELSGAVAALVDRNWFMVFDNYMSFTEQYNAQGLYWNYFFHHWQTLSTSRFSNAILFTTDAVEGSITVTPSAPTLAKGAQQQFTAVFSGTGSPMQKFNWSLGGNSDKSTNITSEGLLTVGANETGPLTVNCILAQDTSITKAATVTISA